HLMRSPEFARIASTELKTTGPAARKSGQFIPVAAVTVCMIVFNEEEVLRRSLGALVPIFESFIIADMGSSDQTLNIINEILLDKVRIIDYDQSKLLDKGYAAARNFCAEHATSEWILM